MRRFVSFHCHTLLRWTTILLISFLIITGCTSSVPPENIYRHSSLYKGDGAKDIQVESNKDGNYDIIAMSDEAHVPVRFSLGGAIGGDLSGAVYYPDALGSKNIKIAIDKEVGYTDLAGLRFKQEATINIWEDGTIEANKAGIEASDKNSALWISKKVKIKGSKVAIVMVKKK